MSRFWIGDVEFGVGSVVNGLVLSTITGWYDSPEDKTAYTSRATVDGSFLPTLIRRGDRVLDCALGFQFGSRREVVDLFASLNAMDKSLMVIRLDDEDDAFCVGVVTFSLPKTYGLSGAFSATVTCPDPFRYGTALQEVTLSGSAAVGKGLSFIPDGETDPGLDWPVSFGGVGLDGANVAVLTNGGNASAWPSFTTVGEFPSGFRLELGDEVLEWDQPVAASAPVTLDCQNMRGLVLGVDQTVGVSRQGWVSVPAGGRLPVVLHPLEASSGYVIARVRDTWI